MTTDRYTLFDEQKKKGYPEKNEYFLWLFHEKH